MKALLGAAVPLALLAGCAGDKLTLLDNEEGAETGAVAVINEKRGDEVLVDRPLTEAKLSSRPKPRAVKQLKPAYTDLLGALPPKARPFPIAFKVNEFEISADQRGTLEDIRTELSIRPGAQIEVVGFTDSTGEEELNNTISKGRAKSVADELRKYGFPVDPSDEVGRGEFAAREKNGENVADESFRTVIVLIR